MTPARWSRVKEIFSGAIDKPEEERAAYIRSECDGDADLVAEVEGLLAYNDTPSLPSPLPQFLEHLAEPAVLPYQIVNSYRVLERVGSGGMGLVYRALDVKLDRHVALKFLTSGMDLDDSARAALLREARAASALDHPNIGTIFGIEETPAGQPFIVMAFYEGQTLAQKLRAGPLPPAEAADIGLQAARGLAEAHAHSIVHRDVKPSNIFLTRQGLVKIVDFGIARVIRSATSTRSGGIAGTAAYMSPEQAQGQFLDARTDLWSLGAVLYEMLSGRRAFPSEDLAATLFAIVNEAPAELPDGLPPVLQKVVYRALAKKPDDRYRTAGEMIPDLQQVSGPAGAASDPTASSDDLGRYRKLAAGPSRKRRIRRRVLLTALPLLVAVIAVLGLIFRPFGTKPAAYESYLKAGEEIYRYDKPGNLDRAISRLEAAVKTDPDFALGFASLGSAYWMKSRLERDRKLLASAESSARRALELNGNLAEVHVVMGQVQGSLGHRELAQEEFLHALKLDPSSAAALAGLAGEYAARQRVKEAEDLYRRAADLRPDSWWGYNDLGGFLKSQKRPAEAALQYRHAIQLTPDNMIPYVNLAAVLADAGSYSDAEATLKQALKRNASSFAVYANLGAMYYRQRRFTEALEAHSQAVRLNDRDWRIWRNLAQTYRTLGDQAAAVAAYRHVLPLLEQAVKVEPQSAFLQARLAEAYAYAGMRDEVESRVHAALAFEPQDSGVLLNCADAYAVLNDRARAVAIANEAVANGLTLAELDQDPEAKLYRADPGFQLPKR